MHCTRAAKSKALAVLAGLCWAAAAHAQQGPLVTGSFGAGGSGPDSLSITFTCRGAPVCDGQFSLVERIADCSNTLYEAGKFQMNGLNLGQSGSLSGTMVVEKANNVYTRLANGTCVIAPGATDATVPYTGTWNAATRTGSIVVTGDIPFPGTFTADTSAPAPVFPMTVRSSIGPVTSSASADIQFRPQDVGTSGGVFVFALAPSASVQGAQSAGAMHIGKADASSCVIAQLDGAGKLVAVSNSQFQAAVSGVLSAQGATVSIMNNVSTPSVAGATFYVGYGASGAAMLDNGIFRNAVLVPGSGVCPMLPYATALWWNPDESGWGLNLNQQGNTAFGTLFTYDAARAPLWLVMSGGVLQADGLTYSGDLYRTTGPAFNAQPFTPITGANVTKVGAMSIAFSHANAATLTYSVNGATVTKSIQRQVYGSRSANCMPSSGSSRASSTHYQDLWWNANESGWGLNLTHQDQTLFGTLFTYDASGRDLWLVMSGGTRQGDGSYAGDLYRTSGSPFNAVPFTPVGASDVTKVGTMGVRFTDGDHGTLTYTYAGSTVTKAITRQLFSAPVSACN